MVHRVQNRVGNIFKLSAGLHEQYAFLFSEEDIGMVLSAVLEVPALATSNDNHGILHQNWPS